MQPAETDWTTFDWSPHVHEVEIEGRRVRYVEVGSGPAVVLIHGTGGSWTTWLLNLRELATDHRVVAVDVPGFGASESPGASADLAPYADGIVRLIDHLDIDRAVFVGHSLGGLIVLRLALRHPERVAGIVSVDGGGVTLTDLRLRIITVTLKLAGLLTRYSPLTRILVRRARIRTWVLRPFLRETTHLNGPLVQELLGTFGTPGLLDAIRAGGVDDAASRIGDISAPVLVIWGRRDPILPLALAELLVAELHDARLEVFERSGHCPMFEEPARFNQAVSAWLDEQVPTG